MVYFAVCACVCAAMRFIDIENNANTQIFQYLPHLGTNAHRGVCIHVWFHTEMREMSSEPDQRVPPNKNISYMPQVLFHSALLPVPPLQAAYDYILNIASHHGFSYLLAWFCAHISEILINFMRILRFTFVAKCRIFAMRFMFFLWTVLHRFSYACTLQ